MAKHKYMIGLDLLRLIAASLVVIYHFGFWDWTPGQPLALALPNKLPHGARAWACSPHFGWVGVEIFFVISGFVIAYSAADARPAAFLRGRFLRLAPVNWIGATMVLLIPLALGRPASISLLVHYVETLAFWPLDAIEGVWWTLGIEIDFYLLTYLLIRRGRAAQLETVMTTIGLVSALFWIAALSMAALLDGQIGSLGLLRSLIVRSQHNRELQLLLVQHGCLFALGVLLWKTSVAGMDRKRACAMAMLTGACLLEIVGQNGIISRASQTSLSPVPALLTWCAAMAFFAVSVACNARLVGMLGRWLPAVRFAGLLTYPLYLLHNAVGVGLVQAFAPRLGMAAVGLGVAGAFAAAAVVAGLVEPWLRKELSGLVARLMTPRNKAEIRSDGAGTRF